MNLISETLNKTHFKRGIDPKESMGLGAAGVIPSITSDDLQDLEMYLNGEAYMRELFDDDYDIIYTPDVLERLELISIALKGKIRFGEYFDHKQGESMDLYLDRRLGGKGPWRYAYNGTPGQDGWGVVLSKIELPQAEPVID